MTSLYDGSSELWQPHYELLFKHWPSLKEASAIATQYENAKEKE